jgi:hypothetical protein
MKSHIQEELILKELEMAKEIANGEEGRAKTLSRDYHKG